MLINKSILQLWKCASKENGSACGTKDNNLSARVHFIFKTVWSSYGGGW